MKAIFFAMTLLALTVNPFTAEAQLWKTDDRALTDPVDYYANRNGTYPFQFNPNNNMGTSPNNATFKNDPAFYNKDNYIQNRFPTENGSYYVPGSLGNTYNNGNFINNNTPGSYNYRDANGQAAPVYTNPRNSGNFPAR